MSKYLDANNPEHIAKVEEIYKEKAIEAEQAARASSDKLLEQINSINPILLKKYEIK